MSVERVLTQAPTIRSEKARQQKSPEFQMDMRRISHTVIDSHLTHDIEARKEPDR